MEMSTPLVVGFVGSFLLLGVLTLTAFVKLSVVLMILRNAIGLQQVPSNMVMMTLTLFLALFISLPVISEAFTTIAFADFEDAELVEILGIFARAIEPFQAFILDNTSPEQLAFFRGIALDVWAGSAFASQTDSIFIQVPAFLISELTRAFEIGFLLYLPFIAIDLAVTVILMAMGMQQVQPSIISTPFKLLLFVTLDGWSKLIEALVLSYAGA